jgi:hypothetical protein
MSSRVEKVWPSLEQRVVVFRALVEAQDRGASVYRSRQAVAEQFCLRDSILRRIEQEGVEHDWPPLSD